MSKTNGRKPKQRSFRLKRALPRFFCGKGFKLELQGGAMRHGF